MTRILLFSLSPEPGLFCLTQWRSLGIHGIILCKPPALASRIARGAPAGKGGQ